LVGCIGFFPPYIDIHDLNLTVKDVLPTNGPYTQILYSHLPPLVAGFINNIHIKFNPSVEDAFIWTPNKNGTYTTKSGYTWLLPHTDMVSHFNFYSSWSWIWKLKLPEKFKFLFWLACHDSVPTFFFVQP